MSTNGLGGLGVCVFVCVCGEGGFDLRLPSL